MEKINGGNISYDCVIALGNFDGLHKAHMEIIKNAISYSKENNIKSGALLFSNHTLGIINGETVERLTTEEEKLEILSHAGLDFAYILDFHEKIMHMSPEEFVTMLKKRLSARAACVGYDYRFGFRAEGDVELLKSLGKQYGIDVLVTDELSVNGIAVKSTYIRSLVKNGEPEKIREFLGRNYSVGGKIVSGLQNGRKIGFPTANIEYGKDIALPRTGVYMGYTTIGENRYKSVINVGNNPAFNAEKITIESHILDFNEDVYGHFATVEFVRRLRGDKKFDSLDALKAQIEKDVEAVRKCI